MIILVFLFTNFHGKSLALEAPPSVEEVTSVNGGIRTVVELTNGQIMLGGTFTKVAGKVRLGIARLNADGTLDETFQAEVPGPPIPGTLNLDTGEVKFNKEKGAPTFPNYFTNVMSIVEDNDGYLIVAENANYYANFYGFLRLKKDGKWDSGYRSTYSGNLGFAPVRMIRLPSGKIAIGGIAWVEGQSKVRIALLDKNGDFDKSFSPNPSNPREAWGGFLGFAHLADESLLVATGQPRIGEVASLNNPCVSIYKYDSKGAIDVKWESQLSSVSIDKTMQIPGPLYLARVNSFAQFEDGRVLISGGFKTKDSGKNQPDETCYGGFGSYVLLNADGTLNNRFVDREMAPQTTWSVIDEDDDGFLLQGMVSFLANGAITFVNADGSIDKTNLIEAKQYFDERIYQSAGVFSKLGRYALVAGEASNSLLKDDKGKTVLRKIWLPPSAPKLNSVTCSRSSCQISVEGPLRFGPSFEHRYVARFEVNGKEQLIPFQGVSVQIASQKWGSDLNVSVRAEDKNGVSKFSEILNYVVPPQVPLPPSILQSKNQDYVDLQFKVQDSGGVDPTTLTISRLEQGGSTSSVVEILASETYRVQRGVAPLQIIAKFKNSIGESDWSEPTTIEKLVPRIQKVTIYCLKGKQSKKVTAVNPKCPKGYKKK